MKTTPISLCYKIYFEIFFSTNSPFFDFIWSLYICSTVLRLLIPVATFLLKYCRWRLWRWLWVRTKRMGKVQSYDFLWIEYFKQRKRNPKDDGSVCLEYSRDSKKRVVKVRKGETYRRWAVRWGADVGFWLLKSSDVSEQALSLSACSTEKIFKGEGIKKGEPSTCHFNDIGKNITGA